MKCVNAPRCVNACVNAPELRAGAGLDAQSSTLYLREAQLVEGLESENVKARLLEKGVVFFFFFNLLCVVLVLLLFPTCISSFKVWTKLGKVQRRAEGMNEEWLWCDCLH